MVVGQIMNAVLSGKYDLSKTAIIITQTGGGHVLLTILIYKTFLEKANLAYIPVISLCTRTRV